MPFELISMLFCRILVYFQFQVLLFYCSYFVGQIQGQGSLKGQGKDGQKNKSRARNRWTEKTTSKPRKRYKQQSILDKMRRNQPSQKIPWAIHEILHVLETLCLRPRDFQCAMTSARKIELCLDSTIFPFLVWILLATFIKGGM